MEVLQVNRVVLDLAAGSVVERGRADLEFEHEHAARTDQDGVGAGAEADDAEFEHDVPRGGIRELGQGRSEDPDRGEPGPELGRLVGPEAADGLEGETVANGGWFGGEEGVGRT